ncbi:hypothetical protein NP493_407g03016 [Ridgeia piscesae]|uniref:Uncharacterized protein n=1 Tax=Ridgeia piscesae TaxID=27915 RepID=A0AAD9L1A6_RIDPI|nr:hypothetical protein NP493_407g03016 [Ridgeia piscesae]
MFTETTMFTYQLNEHKSTFITIDCSQTSHRLGKWSAISALITRYCPTVLDSKFNCRTSRNNSFHVKRCVVPRHRSAAVANYLPPVWTYETSPHFRTQDDYVGHSSVRRMFTVHGRAIIQTPAFTCHSTMVVAVRHLTEDNMIYHVTRLNLLVVLEADRRVATFSPLS